MKTSGDRQRPGFMHPAAIGRVQNDAPVAHFIATTLQHQMSAARNDPRGIALLLDESFEVGERVFIVAHPRQS